MKHRKVADIACYVPQDFDWSDWDDRTLKSLVNQPTVDGDDETGVCQALERWADRRLAKAIA